MVGFLYLCQRFASPYKLASSGQKDKLQTKTGKIIQNIYTVKYSKSKIKIKNLSN